MRFPLPSISLAAAGAALLLAGSAGPATASANRTVRLRGFEFKPHVVHVGVGGRVTWKAQDKYVTHTVTSRGKKRFKSSGPLAEGKSYAVTFRKTGTYRFVCTIHAGMKGRIVVR